MTIIVSLLTPNGVIDGFLCLLYAKFESLDVRPDLVSSVVEYKSILKISHGIHCLSLLIKALRLGVICIYIHHNIALTPEAMQHKKSFQQKNASCQLGHHTQCSMDGLTNSVSEAAYLTRLNHTYKAIHECTTIEYTCTLTRWYCLSSFSDASASAKAAVVSPNCR